MPLKNCFFGESLEFYRKQKKRGTLNEHSSFKIYRKNSILNFEDFR